MPRGRGHYRRDNRFGGPRKNERIRTREVRLITADGRQIGIVPTEEALKLARQSELDLVEVAPNVRPPVCRILDFGKYMYEESKKSKGTKTHASKIKEVKFRVRIEQHDYMTKLRHAEEFLHHGDKVKLTLTLRGREMEHKDLAFETMQRAIGDLTHIGAAESPPRMTGRHIGVMLSPLPANKRRLKYNESDDEATPRNSGSPTEK